MNNKSRKTVITQATELKTEAMALCQGLEGEILIPHSHSFFVRIPHSTFSLYQYPASHAQFWQIPLGPGTVKTRISQRFFSEISDPENTRLTS